MRMSTSKKLCMWICTSNQYSNFRGPLRECRSNRSGASGLPYYCAPLACVSAVIDSLTVCRHNKPKPQKKKNWTECWDWTELNLSPSLRASAFEGVPSYYCTPPLTAPDVIGARGVCWFVLLNWYWVLVMYGPGASLWASQGRRTHDPRSPTSQPHPVPP